jgi:outer membrane murein-binding lipoprotein Lpp
MRRLLLAALLAVLTLTGCQAAPGVAAYVGDIRLLDSQVERDVEAIESDVAAAGRPLPAEAYGEVRQILVRLFVFNEVARRYAAERGYQVPPVDYQGVAGQIGLPATDPYVRLIAESEALRQTLLQHTQPATPTEAELLDAYRRIETTAPGRVPPFDEIRVELGELTELRQGVAIQRELVAAAQRYGVDVSPRYQPLEFVLAYTATASPIPLVALPLGSAADDAVHDLT